MSTTNLTIVIVTKNRPLFLKRCLNRLLPQASRHRVPILIIDNASRPTSKVVFQAYQKTAYLKYKHLSKTGIPHSRNFAFKKNDTPYLAFIDDDCLPSKGWVKCALNCISQNPHVDFIIGQSILENHTLLAKSQYTTYRLWFKNHCQDNYRFDSRALDTKNIIFKRTITSSYLFDENFKIFEDVDLGHQLFQANKVGIYQPLLRVVHPENNNLSAVIKKNYYRGQIKYRLDQKWSSPDQYHPPSFTDFAKSSIKSFLRQGIDLSQVFSLFFNYVFGLGYQKAKYSPTTNCQIAIVNSYDHAANEERLKQVSKFLASHHLPHLQLNSQHEFDLAADNLRSILFFPANFISYRFFRFLKYHFNLKVDDKIFYYKILLRGQATHRFLTKTKVKLAIIQHPEDLNAITSPRQYQTIYDAPTIFSVEVKSFPHLGSTVKEKIGALELKAFKLAEAVDFHWYSFATLARQKNIHITNLFKLNWGTSTNSPVTAYSPAPRMVYLGNLNSPWINPPLLASLQSKSPIPINIFSYDSPPKSSRLQTSGFMKNIDDISQYQFGLLSFTNDELRNNGFSAKHLLYISYGIPVFCPEWRQDELLKPATIPYNETNFASQVNKYSNPKLWQVKHLAALNLAKKLSWDKNLIPLLKQISILLKNSESPT